MIGLLERWWRAARRRLSRSEWIIRALGLSRSEGTTLQPGLLLVQIDGLSRTHLHRALREHRLPFLRRLLAREGYIEHACYSGVPASTPAVQAELFYGVAGSIPAFCFRDCDQRRVRTMYYPPDAAAIEQRLRAQGAALLEGGSAYGDIFSGGAAETHWCCAAMGWDTLLQGPRRLLMLLLHPLIVIRIVALMVVELALAVVDSFRGMMEGKSWFEEFQFILTRVGLCILMRELIVVGAKIDIARGLPVIHVNFLGYDEQAHRRGPSSAFAHWSLSGIDQAIARLWQAAHSSMRRHYDVWLYSDHGQEDTIAYPLEHGRTVEQAVNAVVGKVIGDDAGLVVTCMGSLGHVYPTQPWDAEQQRRLAHALISEAKIPMVLLRAAAPGQAEARTAEGEYLLPQDAARLFGEDHPYLQEVASELAAVCHHPDAGALVIAGWRRHGRPVSFPVEHGSHTGPGREETNAFALLPPDAPLPKLDRPYLRARDLRDAVNRHLGRSEPAATRGTPRLPEGRVASLRVMTYNVHSCIGMDGRLSPARIARVIARYAPDAVALQELEVGRWQTGGVDQAEWIATRLDMTLHFHAAIRLEAEGYGNAVMSRYPMQVVRAGHLPQLRPHAYFEPRGALWVTLDVRGTPVHLLNAHLSLWPRERRLQVETLLGPEWLSDPRCQGPVLLCGDLNMTPGSHAYRHLQQRLQDAQRVLRGHRPLPTWFGRYPLTRLDHVFVAPGTDVMSIEVPTSELAKVASDHLPLIVEIRVA